MNQESPGFSRGEKVNEIDAREVEAHLADALAQYLDSPYFRGLGVSEQVEHLLRTLEVRQVEQVYRGEVLTDPERPDGMRYRLNYGPASSYAAAAARLPAMTGTPPGARVVTWFRVVADSEPTPITPEESP